MLPAVASSSQGVSFGLVPVERVVDEAVGELVVLAPNSRVRNAPQLARESRRVGGQLPQRRVFHLVLASHLLHEQLGVGDDLERRFARVRYTAVRRAHNELADRLVNEALDAQA